jgi:hypothetical protein
MRLSADETGYAIRERYCFNYDSTDLEIAARKKMENHVVPEEASPLRCYQGD